MTHFSCDYNEGVHERILKKLAETNPEQAPGYGENHYCTEAAGIIRGLCERENAAAHFPVGGARTNLVVIVSALRSHQGAVGVATAHTNVHKANSTEATGHKVLALPYEDGKITVKQVEELYQAHIRDESFEHTVQPKMVYISNPMGLGATYTRAEMENLYGVCRRYGLYLFVDGARLAYGLVAEGNGLDLKSLATSCDVFYIGGVRVGALSGEAVIILNDGLKADFCYHIKQRSGILAKGRLLGTQFEELLWNGLYFELGAHADRLAGKIRYACVKKGYPFLAENTINQVFPIMPDAPLELRKDKYSYINRGRVDGSHMAVYPCTSQITSGEQVDILASDISDS